jgi:type II secretion system protein C
MKQRLFYNLLLFTLIIYFGIPAFVFVNKSTGAPPPDREDAPVKVVPLATEDLGLQLMGTVEADNPEISMAVIHNQATKKQGIYREGDRIGKKAVVEKILRNRVIIDAGRGEEMLTMLHGQPSVGSGSRSTSKPAVTGRMAQQHAVKSNPINAHSNPTIQLSREEVESSLKNVDQLMQQVQPSLVTVYNRPAGIKITNIPTGSILSKMGLASGHVIIGVNDEAITSPEQLSIFLQGLKQGGDFTIKIRKRGVRRRTRLIQLEIK